MRRHIGRWFDPFDLIVTACQSVLGCYIIQHPHLGFCLFNGDPAAAFSLGRDFRFDVVTEVDFELADEELASLSLAESAMSLSDTPSSCVGDAGLPTPLSLCFVFCAGSGVDDSSPLVSSMRSSLSISLEGIALVLMLPVVPLQDSSH